MFKSKTYQSCINQALLVFLTLYSCVKTLVLQMWLNDPPTLYELIAITVGNDLEKSLQIPL